jgi:hypothetical protein
MRLRWFFIFVVGIFVSALVCAQPPSIDLSDALYFENGTIANGIYSNECLGFSLPIPAGWNINTQAGHDDKAMPHQRGLRLFVVDRPGPNASVIGIRIEMEAYDAVVEKATPQEYVSRIAHTRNYAAERILLRDAYEVPYGGRQFFRADYKEDHGSIGTLFFASIFTQFRGHLVGETVTVHSPEELDQVAASLLGILFLEDRINPNCLASLEKTWRVG